MGIFTRVRDIVSSNLNTMLEKAEDPDKLIKLMIQEMEDTLVEIKASCAGTMAAEKKAARAWDQALEKVSAWQERAELAVVRGKEDLAREALTERRRLQERADALEQEVSYTQSLIGQYQEEIIQLEGKIASAREKQRMLVQRHRAAEGRKRAQENIRRYDSSDAFTRFNKLENRIERMEAEADLVNFGRKPTLEDEFTRLEHDEEIERQLQELKARRAGDSEGV